MKIAMTPDVVRMAEELTRARAVEHASSLLVALNGAGEYAMILAGSPALAEHAKVRAELYTSARIAIENVFQALDSALAQSSVEAHAPATGCPKSECVEPADHTEHCVRADGSIILRQREGAIASALAMPGTVFVQPVRLCVRYVDDLEECRLVLENGRATFAMDGVLEGDAFLEDASGRREPVVLNAKEVRSGQAVMLDAATLARVAPPGVVPIQKRDRR